MPLRARPALLGSLRERSDEPAFADDLAVAFFTLCFFLPPPRFPPVFVAIICPFTRSGYVGRFPTPDRGTKSRTRFYLLYSDGYATTTSSITSAPTSYHEAAKATREEGLENGGHPPNSGNRTLIHPYSPCAADTCP